MILGITGGIGCGKSRAAEMFERRGFKRIDSDALVREQVLTSPAVVEAVKTRYGAAVVTTENRIDRAALAEKVFNDDAERRWLEQLTHPLVLGLWREALAAAPRARWVVEVPLLFEQSLENWFDFTVCVACSPDLQLVR